MESSIDAEIVVAYTQCQTKAFFLLCTRKQRFPHEYTRCLHDRTQQHKTRYLNTVRQANSDVTLYSLKSLHQGKPVLLEARLCHEHLTAYADVLVKSTTPSRKKHVIYEPTIVVGTHTLTKEQKIHVSFTGYVLSKMLNAPVSTGFLVSIEQQTHSIKIKSHYPEIERIVKHLNTWLQVAQPSPPTLILNKHCTSCPFEDECYKKTEETDNLSLLGGMIPKAIQKYHKKGIFTITQLSYLFRPRKNRKKRSRTIIRYRPEVQALALRTEKIYLQELPNIRRHAVELFLDIEGIPDPHFYYLIGVIIRTSQEHSYHPFWADTQTDEQTMWGEVLEVLTHYPDAPIYHYGSYDARAFRTLKTRFGGDTENGIQDRLVNINASIYGEIYFPVHSNTLKTLGKFVGATWTHPNASGLQSLVWRYAWENEHDDQHKHQLLIYNEEDCRALWLLTDKLSEIQTTASDKWNIDFADQPKQQTTDIGSRIHEELEQVLQYAHADYTSTKISVSESELDTEKAMSPRKRNKTHAYLRIPPNPTKVITVPRRRVCPHCKGCLESTEQYAETDITDFHFMRNGCRRIVLQYRGQQGFCAQCHKSYPPKTVEKFRDQVFGHALMAWAVYHRVVLRLPYHFIPDVMETTFGERISKSTTVNFIRHFARYYARTEQHLVHSILASPFVHVDETQISVGGEHQYVWGFTDGEHVVFRRTATREATIALEFLANYPGVVITDFYPGYDSLKCRQQKCWVHLIRDLNDDLWKEPFNTEFEQFVLAVKELIVPILQTAQRYGLKKYHFHKFEKAVTGFYHHHIENRVYRCEVTQRYQKRFQRYKDSLFTFLKFDGISWNNNMAERAIRHLTVQRKISGSFYDGLINEYLLLLGIAQTCRFQKKPFLKFLVSQEKIVDAFNAPRAKKHSRAIKVTKDRENISKKKKTGKKT